MNIFWITGYINEFSMPLARKHRITRVVQVKRFNESFNRFDWCDVVDKYKNSFIACKECSKYLPL